MFKKVLYLVLIAAILVGLVIVIVKGYDPGTTPTCATSDASIRIKRDLYEVCYNWQNKQPSWVLQFYYGGNQNVIPPEEVNLYRADPEIPKNSQPSAQDYNSSTWILGNYLFPFSEQALELSNESEEDQYFFSVTSPQNPDFHSGYWRKLRTYVKNAGKDELVSNIAVLSGPLFLSENQNQGLGILKPNGIPVPTHFFQVIVPNSNAKAIEVYIVPNQKIDLDVPLDHFKYTLQDFEKIADIRDVQKIARNFVVPVPP